MRGETREMRRIVATRFDELGRHLERLNRLEERFDREIEYQSHANPSHRRTAVSQAAEVAVIFDPYNKQPR